MVSQETGGSNSRDSTGRETEPEVAAEAAAEAIAEAQEEAAVSTTGQHCVFAAAVFVVFLVFLSAVVSLQ